MFLLFNVSNYFALWSSRKIEGITYSVGYLIISVPRALYIPNMAAHIQSKVKYFPNMELALCEFVISRPLRAFVKISKFLMKTERES